MRTDVPTLEELGSGRHALLHARTIVGRLHTCHLQIASPSVSALHAQIVWDGSSWQVQDLNSRNGTYVDGRRLSAGQQAALARETTVSFGCNECRYRLRDDSAPVLMAETHDGQVVVAVAELLCIPNAESCELTIYRDRDRRWVVGSDAGERVVEDNEIVTAGRRAWRIGLPGVVSKTDGTQPTSELDLVGATLTFLLSRDGEHVTATIEQAGTTVQLECRAHLFLLLELARARLDDSAQEHLPASEHGWVYRDELMSALGVDETNLNIWVHRARQHLIKGGVQGAGALFERRSGTRQLRIGIERLSIA